MINPVQLNPERVTEELSKFGEKLAKGMQSLKEVRDVHYGASDKEEVYREDKLRLYRFKSAHKTTEKVPLLIVYALVNRPYMVDLQDDRSIVKNLLAAGHDVYLIDWGYPDQSDRFLTLDDYINGYIRRCVQAVCKRHGLPSINILGICQGGAFSICYASLYPETVKNLITMVTPVDFQTPDNMLSHWVQDMDIDLFVDTLGNVPADLMNWCYLTLKPFRLLQQKYVGLTDILDNKAELENFLRMEKWIFDSPDQAGDAFRQFLKDFYQGNKLLKGGLSIGGKAIDTRRVSMPVLNIFAEQDHLVPPTASKALKGIVGTKDYTELSFKGGHIGIYVSGRAQREVPPAIDSWLRKRG
ncbi:class III poly(R)-hydroxyalkanoic acid synthase subunit PhaC [Ahniella affigens]|uniref:Poly(3-hydroxyalkanoate) polymerase subunit PhaC n=1 Tax=Ahniella affigens TaxID=2021234 RepID=A0A2P1PPV0_9GAMM|nr:class III poly(R)-hydroxyalkanoic acid synthase subunit PhaC [Ahniella affigens]AVP96864.1 class III poly(R)-hydroxyalkanoic acid synthase subunit PhaC [Ahniella affigens]